MILAQGLHISPNPKSPDAVRDCLKPCGHFRNLHAQAAKALEERIRQDRCCPCQEASPGGVLVLLVFKALYEVYKIEGWVLGFWF